MTLNSILMPRLLFVAAVTSAALLAPPASSALAQKESFTGFAINLNAGPKTAVVDFTIERWSSNEERDQLIGILREEKNVSKANSKLLKTLQGMPGVGYIRTSTSLAWDVRYAYQSDREEGGRRIVLATDRPIAFAEARNSTRSVDYPFTIVEIHLDKADKGVGKILAGTKLYIDKNNNLVLEQFGQQPVRFNEIKKVS